MTTSIMLQPQALQAVMDYAAQMVASGYLPKAIDTPQKAVAIISLGYELGLTPWAAFNGVNVIAGKPTISPALMLGLINRSGFLENMTIEADDTRAIVTMKRNGRDAHTETFTIEDASRMKTTEWANGSKRTIALSEKDNWKQQPRVMLKWRAVSACARVVFPDVLAGLYTTEEIAPDSTKVSEDGEITYEPPPMLDAGKPALRDGDKVRLMALGLEIKHTAKAKVLIFDTDNDDVPTVLAYSRKLFQDANWCDEHEWLEPEGIQFSESIPVEATYHAEKNYWIVTAVDPLDVDFMATPKRKARQGGMSREDTRAVLADEQEAFEDMLQA